LTLTWREGVASASTGEEVSAMHTVGEVARMSDLTVRTLHHYDEIGLLVPSERSETGYRLYTRDDLERLQEILVHRALGFPLDEVRRLLDDPAHDRVAALRRQRELLLTRTAELGGMLRAVEAALDAHEEGTEMTDDALFDGLPGGEYAEEAEERWGHTDEWAESRRRTRDHSPEDWQRIQEEMAAEEAALAELFHAGEPAESAAAMDVAEALRQHISRWFYPCPLEMHANLGDMYVADPRFTAHYDEPHGEGFAAYVRDAIHANVIARS
jgi:DNA-binding transcriptional MerR regulator